MDHLDSIMVSFCETYVLTFYLGSIYEHIMIVSFAYCLLALFIVLFSWYSTVIYTAWMVRRCAEFYRDLTDCPLSMIHFIGELVTCPLYTDRPYSRSYSGSWGVTPTDP